MSVNLLDNAKKALTGYPIDQLVAWTDSSNALHCIRGNDNYKQFVKNRADKIREKKEIAWRYVNTNEILADIGSRGMSVAKIGELRWKGPGWLRDSDNWSSNIKTKATAETEKEARIIKVMKTSTTLKSDIMDKILAEIQLLEVPENDIMDTKIPAQLQKTEIGKTIMALDNQRNREF